MKIIQRGMRRPGEKRQRTTYDKDGRVLIPGSRERERITLEGKQSNKHIPPSGSKATPAPKGPGMEPLKGARAGAAKDTSHRQSPGNSSDTAGIKGRPNIETTETGSMMQGSQAKRGKIFPGMRRAQTTLMTQAKR
jgi:hypothetical protein